MNERTVLITGGSRGIGAAISDVFHTAGCHVVIAGRTDNGFSATLGQRASFVATDVRRPKALQALVKRALDLTGRIDVLVNNAGLSAWCPLAEINESFWQNMIDTNLKSVLFACQATAPHIPRGGSIINISSLAGKRGSANNSVYCASKFGVNGITQALAKELGLKSIRVNAVCPVYVETEGVLDALKEKASPAGGKNIKKYLKEFAQNNAALRRLPLEREVAELCLYLSSDNASAITGQCINVDCGVLPQ